MTAERGEVAVALLVCHHHSNKAWQKGLAILHRSDALCWAFVVLKVWKVLYFVSFRSTPRSWIEDLWLHVLDGAGVAAKTSLRCL